MLSSILLQFSINFTKKLLYAFLFTLCNSAPAFLHLNISIITVSAELYKWIWRVGLAPWNRFKPSSKILYWFSKAVLLLCIFYVFVCLVFAMPLCAFIYMCLMVTCWERADLLALVCGVLLSLSLSHWYPGSGVVLDCIESWSLHPYYFAYDILVLTSTAMSLAWAFDAGCWQRLSPKF